jgi:hypothetical protein
MPTNDMMALAADLLQILQSPLYVWAVFALIVVPRLVMVYGPRLVHDLAGVPKAALENAGTPSRTWHTALTVLLFVLSSGAQAVIGAMVLVLLRYAGINLM